MSKNASLGAYGVMYVVKYKKSEVVALLLKNGVVVPENPTDMQLALLVTDLLKVSKSFYNEFSKLLVNKDVVYGMSANMSGSYANAGGFVAPDLNFDENIFSQNTTSTTTTTPKDTKSSSSTPSWINQGLGLLQTGFQGYLQLDDNKTKRELANASVQISSSQGSSDSVLPPASTGMSTGAIVGLSVLGIAVVGGIIYFVTKNKSV
jgi:hypothetical protein